MENQNEQKEQQEQQETKLDQAEEIKKLRNSLMKNQEGAETNKEPRKDYVTKIVPREEIAWGDYATCDHGCKEYLQIRAAIIDEVAIELCYLDAREFAIDLVKNFTESETFKEERKKRREALKQKNKK